MRSSGVTGVTNCTSASPCASSARAGRAHSSNGRSGTMKPATPARAASRGNRRDRTRAADSDSSSAAAALAACGLARGELGQNPAQRNALRQRRAARALNRRAVRHRIRERHADLDDIGGRQRPRCSCCGNVSRSRKACSDVRDERRAGRSTLALRIASLIESRAAIRSALLQKRPLQRRHVLVAAAGQTDQNALARIRLRIALRAGERVRRFDRGQDAFGRTALGQRCQRIVVVDGFVLARDRRSSAARAPDRRPDSRAPPTPNAFPGSGRSRPAAAASSCPAARRACRTRATRRSGRGPRPMPPASRPSICTSRSLTNGWNKPIAFEPPPTQAIDDVRQACPVR